MGCRPGCSHQGHKCLSMRPDSRSSLSPACTPCSAPMSSLGHLLLPCPSCSRLPGCNGCWTLSCTAAPRPCALGPAIWLELGLRPGASSLLYPRPRPRRFHRHSATAPGHLCSNSSQVWNSSSATPGSTPRSPVPRATSTVWNKHLICPRGSSAKSPVCRSGAPCFPSISTKGRVLLDLCLLRSDHPIH